MTKIFITGFRHSGTTMTHQLIKSHPQVGWIENEESYIEFDKPKKWVLQMASHKVDDLKKYAWGEKIPWGVRIEDKDGHRAIKITKKWLNYFGRQARCIQVLRHPLDVFLSDRRGNSILTKEFKWQVNTVDKVIDFMNTDTRCAIVIYEELVTYPEVHLPEIFKFLKLNHSKKIVDKVINSPLKFGKINADRAFAYRSKDVKFKYDYSKLVRKVGNKL
jgi:hypothetical protein